MYLISFLKIIILFRNTHTHHIYIKRNSYKSSKNYKSPKIPMSQNNFMIFVEYDFKYVFICIVR